MGSLLLGVVLGPMAIVFGGIGWARGRRTKLLLLLVLLAFGRRIAARDGGWRAAFGLDRIRGRDWSTATWCGSPAA